ncbi:MAG: HAMP domain-containing protein, partial [Rhodocyclaceae bacterium]|nr:HAMP domain-containing protein [Rhodocyclaceae bacterium]
MSLARKLLAVTVLIAVLAIAAIMAATWNAASEAQHGLLRQRVADDVSREARMLEGSLAMIVSDMGMLAEGGAAGLAGEYSGPSIDNLQILVDQVNALMRKRPAYDEIRVELQGAGAPRTLVSHRLDDRVWTVVDPPTAGAGFDALLRERQGLRNSRGRWGGEGPTAGGDAAARGILPRAVFLRAPVRDGNAIVIGAVAITADFGHLVGNLGRPQDDIGFWISDATGRFLHRSEPPGGEAEPAPQANAVDRYGLRDVWGDWLKGGDPQRRVDQPSRAQIVVLNRVAVGEPGGQGDGEFLVVGGAASFAALDAGAAAFRNRVAFVVLVVGVLMVLSLALATGLLVRPIEALTGVANRIAAGEPGVAAPVARRDEIGILARAMVRMADELRKAGKTSEQAALGRMASMIAHDLRNALSSVKMNLQILDHHHRQAGQAQADNCGISLDQVRYMEVILQDMLAFARPGSVELDWTDIGE